MFKVTQVDPPANRTITLEMSETDAEALLKVCYLIGGSVDKSPRAVFDNLDRVLRDVGVGRPIGEDSSISGNVTFKNYGRS